MNLNLKLSPHFTLNELTKSQTAIRRSIDNMPDEAAIENLKALCENVLEPIRQHFKIPFSPGSGYRSLELNRVIGGSAVSQHILGQAVDIELPGISNFHLARWIQVNLGFDQLILEHYTPGQPNSGWVHVSYSSKKNRESVLTYNSAGYSKGIAA